MPIRTYLYVWFCSIFSTSIYKCLKAHIHTHLIHFSIVTCHFKCTSQMKRKICMSAKWNIYILYACRPRYLKLTRHLMHFKHRHDFHISKLKSIRFWFRCNTPKTICLQMRPSVVVNSNNRIRFTPCNKLKRHR